MHLKVFENLEKARKLHLLSYEAQVDENFFSLVKLMYANDKSAKDTKNSQRDDSFTTLSTLSKGNKINTYVKSNSVESFF